MSHDANYYQPPQSTLQHQQQLGTGSGEAWFEGAHLFVRKGGGIPTERCVRCGETASKTLKKKFGWHPSWVWLTILAGLLVYVVVAMCVTKRGELAMGLCPRCARRRRSIILAGIFGVFVAMIAAFATEMIFVGCFLMLVLFVVPVLSMVLARTLTPVYIDDYIMRLKGADSRVMDQSPPWQNDLIDHSQVGSGQP